MSENTRPRPLVKTTNQWKDICSCQYNHIQHNLALSYKAMICSTTKEKYKNYKKFFFGVENFCLHLPAANGTSATRITWHSRDTCQSNLFFFLLSSFYSFFLVFDPYIQNFAWAWARSVDFILFCLLSLTNLCKQ